MRTEIGHELRYAETNVLAAPAIARSEGNRMPTSRDRVSDVPRPRFSAPQAMPIGWSRFAGIGPFGARPAHPARNRLNGDCLRDPPAISGFAVLPHPPSASVWEGRKRAFSEFPGRAACRGSIHGCVRVSQRRKRSPSGARVAWFGARSSPPRVTPPERRYHSDPPARFAGGLVRDKPHDLILREGRSEKNVQPIAQRGLHERYMDSEAGGPQ